MTTYRSTKSVPCLVVLAAVAGGCATTTPTMDVWQPAPVGKSWTTQQRNTGSYGKDLEAVVTRVADVAWKGTPAVALRTASGNTLLQQPADGRWLAMLGQDGRPMTTWDPPAGWALPISVGSSWSGPRKMTVMASGRTFEYEWSCTVNAYEKVTVPAGTFDAFRVDCKTNTDAQDTYWVSPKVHPFVMTKLVRGPKNPGGPGTQETVLLRLPS